MRSRHAWPATNRHLPYESPRCPGNCLFHNHSQGDFVQRSTGPYRLVKPPAPLRGMECSPGSQALRVHSAGKPGHKQKKQPIDIERVSSALMGVLYKVNGFMGLRAKA